MGKLKKADCISVVQAVNEIGVARNTLYSYMRMLGVARYKFPLDKRAYITLVDFERVRLAIAENRE
jgi:ACT domain-containing protein